MTHVLLLLLHLSSVSTSSTLPSSLSDQAVDEGWKGRAQQISLLKSKLARLERDSRGNGASSTSNPRFRSSAAATKGVDAKAEEELNSMSQDRQLAVEVRVFCVCLCLSLSLSLSHH